MLAKTAMGASSNPEVFLPFRSPEHELGQATRVRTTLLVSSLQSMRKRGLLETYLAHLPQHHHAAVHSMIAGQWVPMSLALAHYEACEALGLAEAEINAIGREVGDRIEGTFLATMVRMAGNIGATPWTALSQTGRLYDRLLAGGGGTSVLKVGPKDARVLFLGVALARVPYFRLAMGGVFEIAAELFCSKAYTRVVFEGRTATKVVLHMAWA